MVALPLLYFLCLFRIIYSKNKHIDVSVGIILIFSVSAFFSILIEIFDMYNEWGINNRSINWIYTLFYCLGITVLVYPFTKIQTNKIKGIVLNNQKLFDWIAWISIIASMISLYTSLNKLPAVLALDMRDVKIDFNEYGVGDRNLYEELISIFSSNMAFVLCLFFFSISFLKKTILFNVLLFLSSLSLVVSQFVIAGRTAMVYWLLYLFLFYLLFRRFLPLKTKRIFITSVSIILLALFSVFVLITVDRFEDSYGYNNSPILSIIGYGGQQFNNFCSFLNASDKAPFTLERIMPFTNHFIWGNTFVQRDFYMRVYLLTGTEVNRFGTILGALAINIGIFGTCVYMFLYSFVASKFMSHMKGYVDFSYFLLFSFFISIPVQGLCGIPNTSIAASLNMFYTFFLFYLFKRKIVLK